VNDMYDWLGVVYDFYRSVFDRNSIDGAGAPLRAAVHYIKNHNNAIFDGQKVLFGGGDGVVFDSFARSWIIIAHELTHWLTGSAAGLVYRDE